MLLLVLPPLFFNQQLSLSNQFNGNLPSKLYGLHDAPQTAKAAFPAGYLTCHYSWRDRLSHWQSAIMAPNQDPSLHIMKRTVDWLLSCSTKVASTENLTANSIAKSIDSIHREIHHRRPSRLHQNSTASHTLLKLRKKALCQYGIPLHDLQIGSLMQDLNALNNELPEKHDIFSVASWNNRPWEEDSVLLFITFLYC